MNERIKQLIRQCEGPDADGMGWGFDRERFAELIVKECVDICTDVGTEEGCPYGAIAWDCVDAIKARFEVK